MDLMQVVLSFWDIGSVKEIEDIYKGQVFKVTTVDEVLVLKDLGEESRKQNHNLALQYDILRHLDQAGVPVAVHVLNKEGQLATTHGGHLYALTPYLANGARPDTPGDRRKLYYNYGIEIAKLHVALTSFPVERLEGKVWKNDPSTEMFRDIDCIREYIDAKRSVDYERIVGDISDKMHVALKGLDDQLIHRDCHPGNVLVNGTEVTGFVDCDHLSLGPRLLDLAYFAIHMVFRSTDDRERCDAWLEEFPIILNGYDQVGKLTDKERQAFPYLMIFVDLLFASYLFRAAGGKGAHYQLDALVWLHDNLDVICEQSLRQNV